MLTGSTSFFGNPLTTRVCWATPHSKWAFHVLIFLRARTTWPSNHTALLSNYMALLSDHGTTQ